MSTDGADPRSGLPSHDDTAGRDRMSVRLPPALEAKVDALQPLYGSRSEVLRAGLRALEYPNTYCEQCDQLFLTIMALNGHYGRTDCTPDGQVTRDE